MKRAAFLAALAALALVWHGHQVEGQPAGRVQWIWSDDGTAKDAGDDVRYFRRVFDLRGFTQIAVDEATLDVTADSAFTAWVNGVKLGSGDDWKRIFSFDLKKHLVLGKNVIAVEAKKDKARPGGLLVRLGYTPNGQSSLAVVSDGAWKSSKKVSDGWQKVDFAESGWTPARVLGPIGKTAPWGELAAWGGGGDDRFRVPEGFKVVKAVREPDNDKNFSLVNMCFDDKGRLLVSREGGPILLCTEPDKDGVLQKVSVYCDLVKNSQGMCWVKDALLLVGDGPKGTGLYRCTAGKGDKIDKAEPLHLFQGGMGEHGPHAILHGPDGWLYLVIGNHAWAKVDKLADNSPLTRWPKGTMGPDQGKPGSTEDVLLPRLNDSRGHAADILAPGGTIWRLDHQGKNMSLVSAGFRNHFDAAFSPTGELFTFDSDMEWDEYLPWYRAVRVCHCPPGADFVWRTGAANTPDYYLDSLPPVVETGRGSPVGMEFYDHHAFPAKYRGALFMCDWSIGVIWAVHLERKGASYTGKTERFCTGAPMPVTDCAVGPDGALWFSMGGRGTQGGVFRIEYDKSGKGPEGGEEQFYPQPLAAFQRAKIERAFERESRATSEQDLVTVATQLILSEKTDLRERIKRLDAMHHYLGLLTSRCLAKFFNHRNQSFVPTLSG